MAATAGHVEARFGASLDGLEVRKERKKKGAPASLGIMVLKLGKTVRAGFWKPSPRTRIERHEDLDAFARRGLATEASAGLSLPEARAPRARRRPASWATVKRPSR